MLSGCVGKSAPVDYSTLDAQSAKLELSQAGRVTFSQDCGDLDAVQSQPLTRFSFVEGDAAYATIELRLKSEGYFSQSDDFWLNRADENEQVTLSQVASGATYLVCGDDKRTAREFGALVSVQRQTQ